MDTNMIYGILGYCCYQSETEPSQPAHSPVGSTRHQCFWHLKICLQLFSCTYFPLTKSYIGKKTSNQAALLMLHHFLLHVKHLHMVNDHIPPWFYLLMQYSLSPGISRQRGRSPVAMRNLSAVYSFSTPLLFVACGQSIRPK